MAIDRVAAHDTILADDINKFADYLEGTSGFTAAYLLRALTGNDFIVRLADNAGVRKLVVQDSDGVEVASIDSNGNTAVTGSFAPSSFTFPTSASPAPTTEGQVVWDTDNDSLFIGNGSASVVFAPARYKYKTDAQNFTTTTLTNVTATSGNIAFAVLANTAYRINIKLDLSAIGTASDGGLKLAFTLPTSPTLAYCYGQYGYHDGGSTQASEGIKFIDTSITSGTAFVTEDSFSGGSSAGISISRGGYVDITLFLVTGANAGTVTLQAAQNTAAGTTTIAAAFATCEVLTAE